MTLTEYLKLERKKNNLSQEDAAETIGVSRQTIQHWESGKVLPTKEYFADIIKTYTLSIETFKKLYSEELFKDFKEEVKYPEYPFSELWWDQYHIENIKNFYLDEKEMELIKWLTFYNPKASSDTYSLVSDESYSNLPYEIVDKYGFDYLENFHKKMIDLNFIEFNYSVLVRHFQKYKFKNFKFSYLKPEELHFLLPEFCRNDIEFKSRVYINENDFYYETLYVPMEKFAEFALFNREHGYREGRFNLVFSTYVQNTCYANQENSEKKKIKILLEDNKEELEKWFSFEKVKQEDLKYADFYITETELFKQLKQEYKKHKGKD